VTLQNILKRQFPDSRVSIRSVTSIQDEAVDCYLSPSSLQRVTAVVADIETKHAAFLEFVIYKERNNEVVLPMSGDRSEFASLLKASNKRVKSARDALAAARAFAVIYRLGTANTPIVAATQEGFSVTFNDSGLKGGNVSRQHSILKIQTDQHANVTSTATIVTDEK
jgi:hypothetical protein